MRPSHRRPWLLTFAAALSLMPACRPADPVAVGAALSGQFVDAARMALAEAITEGGLPPLDTVLLSEFSNRAALALEMVDTFLAQPGLVAVVGHSNSSASLATAPLYNSNQIVQIAPTSTAESYSQAGRFSFRLVPADMQQGHFIARAIDSLYPAGARLAVMFVNDDYGRGLRSAFLASNDSARFPVVFLQAHTDEELVSPTPDRAERVAATVSSVVGSRADIVVWLGRATTFQLYLEAIRDQAGTIPVFGGDALASWQNRDTGQGEWTGVRYVDFLDLEGSEALRSFRARYLAQFGVAAGTPEVLSYDAMRLLLAAIRDGARTGEAVREWLTSLGNARPPFQGVSGPIAFDEHGDIARSYVLVTVPPLAPDSTP